MNLKDGFAPFDVGKIDENLPVKSAGTQQRGVQNVGSVRRRHDDDGFVFFESVHLHEELVQSLLSFVVSAAEPGASFPAYGVNLVDKDYAGLSFFGLIEQVSHAAGAHAYEHFDEIGAGNGIERHSRFARHGFRKQRLARSGGTYQEDAFRHSRADIAELFGGFKEFDDLLEFEFFFLCSGDVGKAHFYVFGNLGLGFPEAQRAAGSALPFHHYDHVYSQSAQNQQHQNRENVAGKRVVLGTVQPDSRQIFGACGAIRTGVVFLYPLDEVVAVNSNTGSACESSLLEV